MNIFKKRYKDLSEKEQELLERRLGELDEEELKDVIGGIPNENITYSDDELSEEELSHAIGGVPSDLGEEEFKKI